MKEFKLGKLNCKIEQIKKKSYIKYRQAKADFPALAGNPMSLGIEDFTTVRPANLPDNDFLIYESKIAYKIKVEDFKYISEITDVENTHSFYYKDLLEIINKALNTTFYINGFMAYESLGWDDKVNCRKLTEDGDFEMIVYRLQDYTYTNKVTKGDLLKIKKQQEAANRETFVSTFLIPVLKQALEKYGFQYDSDGKQFYINNDRKFRELVVASLNSYINADLANYGIKISMCQDLVKKIRSSINTYDMHIYAKNVEKTMEE